MNRTRHLAAGKIGFLLCTALLGALTGCIGYVDRPGRGEVYVQPPSVQEDYVYYPGYQVYYSSYRRQYIYLEGRSWVSRPAPPRVSVDVLYASPSVRLDFHDSPANHHASVVKTYPKNWAPPGSSHDNKGGNKEDHKKDQREGN
jgi:hypothetical protein